MTNTMKFKRKKGFTLTELIVVIVIIGILAAVIIPSYASYVKKANQSADIQAVRQMNTILSTYVDGSVTDIAKAKMVLDENDIDIDNYKPLQKNHYFYFYTKNGISKFVYMDSEGNVIFPKNEKIDGVQLISLSGEIEKDNSWINSINDEAEDNKVVSISSGAQLADFMGKYREGDTSVTGITNIKLTNNIDLKGSTETFGKVNSTLIIDGEGENGENYTIKGLVSDSNAHVHYINENGKKQNYGFINQVNGGTVTIKNVNIEGFVVAETMNDSEFGRSGILIGNVYGKSTITIENVNINNCIVYGGDKAGSLIGGIEYDASNSNITIKNVQVTNTTVLGGLNTAKAIGDAEYMIGDEKNNKLTFENCDFSGVTVGVNEAAFYCCLGNNTNYKVEQDGENILISHIGKYADEIKNKLNIDVSSDNAYVPYYYNDSDKGYWCICTNDYYWGNWCKYIDSGNYIGECPISYSANITDGKFVND